MAKKRQQSEKVTRSMDELIAEAQAIDAAKQKKQKKTAEQKAQEQLEAMLAYEQHQPEEQEPKQKYEQIDHDPAKKWDVKIGDKVEYFDPALSYELTGYRPITMTEGLDFNPKDFTKAADTYRTTGRYTSFMPGTFKNKHFWTTEWDRCSNGYTVGKYRLTGQNYFWLNYYRLQSNIATESDDMNRVEDFPGFIAKQYEYFHYLELVKLLKKDGLVFKARGVGVSEIAASNTVYDYTFKKGSTSVITAYVEDFVRTTLSKCWLQLHFLNTQTDGEFRHVRMKLDTDMEKRASKVDKDKNESGWMSLIKGVTHDNPRKLRGLRMNSIYFEEAGSDPVLEKTYLQAEALVRVGGKRMGSRYVQGTGGENGAALAAMKKMFFNPETYKILPYKNTYSQNEQVQYTGFFIPAYTMWFGDDDGNLGFDSRGVVYEDKAKEYFVKVFNDTKDADALLITKAEFCFTPEDAFILEGSNRFDQELLIEQLQAITIHKTVEKPKPIKLHWKHNSEGGVDRKSNPEIEFVSKSPMQIVELPMTDVNGLPYNNLYTIGCLTPGEKVLTDRGLMKVEDVTLDDKLFSINGQLVQIHNLQRYYKENESIYKVKLNNIFSTTTFTGEHPIYCATPKKHYHGAKHAQRNELPYHYYTYDFNFKKMSDVQVGDFVKVPNIYKEIRPIPFEKWDEFNSRIDRRIDNPLGNEDFWWLVGLILGDGWCQNGKTKSTIGIAFNSAEQFYIDKATSVITNLLKRQVHFRKRNGNGAELTFSMQQLWSFLTTNFNRGASNKNIPEWVKFLPFNLKLNLLVGYFAADGCLCKNCNSYSAVSCSLKLLEDFQDIAFSLGLISTVHWLRKSAKKELIVNHSHQSISKVAWTLDIHGEMINKIKRLYNKSDLKLDKWESKDFANHAIPRCFFEDESCNYIYIKISSIEISKYTGIVYNFHCETSTFMCHYIPTHNCDSIDSDATTSTGQTDVSQFCVVVMRRQFGLQPPKIVAIYKERPDHIQTAFENAMKLCKFYNGKMLFEATRVSIKQYFERFQLLNYLMRRPQATANSTTKTNFKQFGVPATAAIIDHQLDLIEQYIVDFSDQIQFPEMLDELLRYSYDNKRKFDIVAALGMVLLADEEMRGKIAKPACSGHSTFSLGYVRNEWGQMELKAINKEQYNYESTGGESETKDPGSYRMHILTPVYKSPGGQNYKF